MKSGGPVRAARAWGVGMSERHFRIILGAWLILGLFINSTPVVYALVGLLLFEGATNLRIPALVSRIRNGRAQSPPGVTGLLNFEAERILRLIIALLVILPYSGTVDLLWWLPWFVGFALIGAGLSGICPMVQALRWAGLK